MSLVNLFLPKECLVENFWESDPVVTKEQWSECARKKALFGYIIAAIILVIILIITVWYFIHTSNKTGLIVTGITGLLLLGILAFQPWWASKKAEMNYDRDKMKWDELVKSNNGDTGKARQIMGEEQLKRDANASRWALANATSNRSSNSGLGTGLAAGIGFSLGEKILKG